MRRALVVGDAIGVLDDIEAALDLSEFDAVAAVNNMIIRWRGHLDYAVTLHPKPCSHWVGIVEAMAMRQRAGLNRPQTWAHAEYDGIDKHTKDWGGSSGLLGVKVMIERGFDRIVCAGIPMSPDQAHFYSPKVFWPQAKHFHRGWNANLRLLLRTTRSMSGWTAARIGRPTEDWLAGGAGE